MQGGGIAILVRNNIKINIIDTCSSLDTDNEATTIFLKDLQFSTSMSIIYILPTSAINTTLLNNIKNSVDNINWRSQRKTHRPQLFRIDEKTDKWVIVLKKNADLFIAENSKPTHGYSRTNTSDIIDYIRAIIKSRDPFLKSALNAISKKKNQKIKNYRNADIQKRIQTLQLIINQKSWRTLRVTQVKEALQACA